MLHSLSSSQSQQNMQKPQKPPSFQYKKGKPVPDEVAAKAREIAQSRSKTSTSIIPKRPIDIVNIEDIKVGKLLGTGSYSSAYEIEQCESHRILKKLRSQVQQNPLLFAACAADLVQEGRILASMSSSHIINIHAWSGPNMMDTYLQGNPESCYLVLEQLYGTLDDKLKKWQAQSNSLWYMIYEETTTPEYLQVLKEKCQHILDLVKALEHLHHQHCVLHRDLKPANIGFDKDGILKVFDFDLARVLPHNSSMDKLYKMTAKVGSPRYMAPEVKQGESYNLKADVYSMGILVYQILSLEVPLKDATRDWSTHNTFIPATWSNELRKVLASCLIHDIAQRPTMGQILSLLDTEILNQL